MTKKQNMTQRFENALRKTIHDKVGCCEETLIINKVVAQEHSYIVFFYVPSIDRHEQTKSVAVLLTEILINFE